MSAVLERLHVPARKLHLLGNGVDLVRFQPRPAEAATARQSLGVGDDQVVAGVVGRLVWEKGFAELFEAARRLRRTRPEVVVVVVGPTDPAKSGSLTQADIDRARAEAGVIFLGERRDVEALYPGFDLFVLPSHREGFPRSAMEAAACGLPIVASDIRGCRQVVDHGQHRVAGTRPRPGRSGRRHRAPSPPIRFAGRPWDGPLASAPRRSSTTAR